MGKRKLCEGKSYFSCDYTGFPMGSSNCYMPSWDATGRVQKKGNYCNWESVHAAAVQGLERDDPELAKIREHLIEVCGKLPEEAPPQSSLQHIKGDTEGVKFDEREWHVECCRVKDEITAVKLCADGGVEQVCIDSNDGSYDTLTKCFSKAVIPRKGKTTPDVAVYWDQTKNLADTLNLKAEMILKQRIYGDCYLVFTKGELCYTARERLLDFTEADYETHFVRKKKAKVAKGVTDEQYAEQRKHMQAELDAVEKTFTDSAKDPQSYSAVKRMPPSSGKKLALLHPEPPPVRRTDSVASYA